MAVQREMPAPPRERRKSPRTRVRIPAQVALRGRDRVVEATIADLTPDGALLRILADGEPLFGAAEQLAIELSLPRAGALKATAVVVWTRPSGGIDHRGRPVELVGVKFTILTTDVRFAIEAFLDGTKPLVLALGFDVDGELRQHLVADARFETLEAASETEAFAILDRREVAVMVVGPVVSPPDAASLLTRAGAMFRGAPTNNIVLAAGRDRSLFQELVDEDLLFYISESPGSPRDLVEIVAGAAWHRTVTPPHTALDVDQSLQVFELARRLSSERDLHRIAEHLLRWMLATLPARRAHVLVYDQETETLWAPGHADMERRESAAAGLAAFAVRTSTSVRIARAADDPRYDREADDPEGTGSERFIAVPITAGTPPPLAVLVGVRAANEEVFTDEELALLELVARESAPAFARLLTEQRLWRSTETPYRREAVVHSQSADERHGDVLRVVPVWTSWAYRVVALAFFVALVVSLVVPVHEYASGPGVVRFEDALELASTQTGVVTSVYAHPGTVVAEGEPLIGINDAVEAADVERLSREFELSLAAFLRDPPNSTLRQQVASARAQIEAAETRLRARTIRAPRAGIVNGVRVRVGQRINQGDVALSLVGGERIVVAAMLPGQYRAELKPGMALQFELAGYEHVYQTCPVESVGQVVSAQEAARYLGVDVPPAAAASGSVVIVRARMNRPTYESGGRRYRYHDGMPGTADVRVRAELLASVLVPASRRFLSRSD